MSVEAFLGAVSKALCSVIKPEWQEFVLDVADLFATHNSLPECTNNIFKSPDDISLFSMLRGKIMIAVMRAVDEMSTK
eukprot:2329871-Pyramimonas_sp.AAC.1